MNIRLEEKEVEEQRLATSLIAYLSTDNRNSVDPKAIMQRCGLCDDVFPVTSYRGHMRECTFVPRSEGDQMIFNFRSHVR